MINNVQWYHQRGAGAPANRPHTNDDEADDEAKSLHADERRQLPEQRECNRERDTNCQRRQPVVKHQLYNVPPFVLQNHDLANKPKLNAHSNTNLENRIRCSVIDATDASKTAKLVWILPKHVFTNSAPSDEMLSIQPEFRYRRERRNRETQTKQTNCKIRILVHKNYRK